MPLELEGFDPAEQVEEIISSRLTKPERWSNDGWRGYQLKIILSKLKATRHISPQKAQLVGIDIRGECSVPWEEIARKRIEAIATYIKGELERMSESNHTQNLTFKTMQEMPFEGAEKATGGKGVETWKQAARIALLAAAGLLLQGCPTEKNLKNPERLQASTGSKVSDVMQSGHAHDYDENGFMVVTSSGD